MVDNNYEFCRYHIVDKSSLKGTSLDGLKYKDGRGNIPFCKGITGGNTWGTRLNGSECHIKKIKIV